MLKIKVADLKPHMTLLNMVIAKKTTIPVLSLLCIEASGKLVTLTGTDLDTTYQGWCEGEYPQGVTFCISNYLFQNIVKSTDALEITLEHKENIVEIRAGEAIWRVTDMSRDQYPNIPEAFNSDIVLNGDRLRRAVRCSLFAITNEQSRFTLSCAKTLIDDGFTMVATDGHRLTWFKDDELTSQTPVDALVPKHAMEMVLKFPGEGISVGEDVHHVCFRTDAGRIIARKATGNFPNFEMVMPKDNDKSAIFDAGKMIRACRQAKFSQDDMRANAIRCKLGENEIVITARTETAEDGYETRVPCRGAKEDISIGFNPDLLLDFLKIVGKGEINMEYKDANAQIQFSAVEQDGYEYKFILMPLRI